MSKRIAPARKPRLVIIQSQTSHACMIVTLKRQSCPVAPITPICIINPFGQNSAVGDQHQSLRKIQFCIQVYHQPGQDFLAGSQPGHGFITPDIGQRPACRYRNQRISIHRKAYSELKPCCIQAAKRFLPKFEDSECIEFEACVYYLPILMVSLLALTARVQYQPFS